jgi:uncharacterized membrane protein
MNAEDTFCRVCGRGDARGPSAIRPVANTEAPAATSGKAIVSLVTGLIGVFPICVVAIIYGHLALSEIKKSAGRLSGRGMAIAGLVLGYLGIVMIPVILIVAAIAIPNLLRARISANEESAIEGIRALAAAEVTYAQSHKEEGYTCSLASLAEAGVLPENLAKGKRDGYSFELTECVSEAGVARYHSYFQVAATPVSVNQSGVRTFCADESAVIKFKASGSGQDCLDKGTVLR